MDSIPSKHYGALARRLREDTGLGVRALASELEVTYSAVARAERGDPALESLAKKAVVYLLGEPSRTGEVADVEAVYGTDDLGLGVDAQEHLSVLLQRERGWRRALVRGVMEEHGCEVETEGAKATVLGPTDGEGGRTVLDFDLDVGTVVATVDDTTTRLRPILTNPFERADRETWGQALEQLAALCSDGRAGWARIDDDFDLVVWTIHTDDEQND